LLRMYAKTIRHGRSATNTFTSRQESRRKVVAVQFLMMWFMNGLRTISIKMIRLRRIKKLKKLRREKRSRKLISRSVWTA